MLTCFIQCNAEYILPNDVVCVFFSVSTASWEGTHKYIARTRPSWYDILHTGLGAGLRTKARTDLTHNLWLLTFDGNLALNPKCNEAKRVLDVGTGTGIWAINYGKSPKYDPG